MSIDKRMKYIIEKLKLTPRKFAFKIGLERADNLYNILKGKSKPNSELIELISKKFNINTHWLITGEGDIWLNDMLIVSDNEETYGKNVNIDKSQEMDILKKENILLKENLKMCQELIKTKDELLNNKDERIKELLDKIKKIEK